MTLTPILSHPSIGDISVANGFQKGDVDDFYKLFKYDYETNDPRLEFPDDRYPSVVDPLPQLPDGEYPVDVKVTLPLIGGAFAPAAQQVTLWLQNKAPPSIDPNVVSRLVQQTTGGNSLKGRATLSVVTNLIETQSKVTLQRTFAAPTDDRALWTAIRNRTAAIGFDRYKTFIDCVFCENPTNPFDDVRKKILPRYLDRCPDDPAKPLSIYGPYAYGVLKLATQVFLTLESGVVIRDNTPGKPKIFDIEKEQIRLNDFSLDFNKLNTELRAYLGNGEQHLPYLDRIVKNLITLDPQNIDEVLPYCLGVLQFRLTSPSLIELIWSYWLEEGMLVQTMKAIAQRFQNRRGSPHDPLGELEFDPLRPLNNLIWGFIQDEYSRLTVPRRAHEYQL